MKSYNGNIGNIRNIIQVDHWNAGNARWQAKRTEIEAALLMKKPDILFVSEANLYDTLPDNMRNIDGYNLYYPEKMMNKHKYVRIVMLAREELDINIHPEWMHEDLSIIWASVRYSTRKRMRVGGVYREHRLLMQPQPNLTVSPMAQNWRWNLIINSWKLASRDIMCTLVGDTNLDYLKWQHPDEAHKKMVEKTRDEMEPEGFTQTVRGYTRQWPGQSDSLLDQCWVNHPTRVICTTNENRSSSDHNYIGVVLRTKDKKDNNFESKRRVWKNFKPENFRMRLRNIDWEPLYSSKNINTVNDYFVEKVGGALEEEAPSKFIQSRKNHCNWVSGDMVNKMEDRDSARQAARISDSQEDWATYRRLRNNCSKELKNCKDEYFKKLFVAFKEAGDSKNTYRTAKKILGWTAPKRPSMLLENGIIHRKPEKIANILQKFYAKKVTDLMTALKSRGRDPLRLLAKSFESWDHNESDRTFTFKKVTIVETLGFIKKLGNTTATGIDRIDSLSIKVAASELCGPISHIINTSLDSGEFANRWKIFFHHTTLEIQ